ncbi:hypothetical protein V8E53_012330 [Lactarius tabidus]
MRVRNLWRYTASRTGLCCVVMSSRFILTAVGADHARSSWCTGKERRRASHINTHAYSHSSLPSSGSATSKRAQCPKSSQATTSAVYSTTPRLHYNKLTRVCRTARVV